MKLSKLLEEKGLIFTHRDAEVTWKNINAAVFDDKMDFDKTEIVIAEQDVLNRQVSAALRTKAGIPLDADVMGFVKYKEKSGVAQILLSSNVSSFKEFERVLAHEMVHQYLITTEGFYGHGPKFMSFKDRIAKYRGMHLLGTDY